MEEQLLDFISHEFLDDAGTGLTADTRLISSGLMDSFSIVSLLAFIEQRFGKTVPPPRATAESFDSVRQMVDLINTL